MVQDINYRIKLFYANWCGHCINFKPHWEKFKKYINDNNMKDSMGNNVIIETEDYEEDSNDMEFKKENISGYPTLIIYKNNTEREQYNDKPDFNTLLKHFDIQNPTVQSGGNNDVYYDKYMKYKRKYVDLKKRNNYM